MMDGLDYVERLEDENRQLIAENERLRADAERYRWLRNDAPDTDPTAPIVCIVDEGFADMLNGTELDAAIDAAMKGGGK